MNKKEKIRKMKGITLVSLVVTIIVLIILAGVSINLTLGENGIITMAKRTRENMELAKVDEERQLNELYMQIEQEGISGEISYDAIAKLVEFKRQIASAITDMGIETAENADASTMSSNIRSLTGASSADKVSYDNTNSGLTATNLQGAVDEIDSEIDELNDSLRGLRDNSLIDQTPGKTYTFGFVGMAVQYSANQGYQVMINFPFVTENINYDISVTIDAIGAVQAVTETQSTVNVKKSTSCLVGNFYKNTVAENGSVSVAYGNYTITFR